MAASKVQFDLLSAKQKLIVLLNNFFKLSEKGDIRTRVLALIPAFNLMQKIGKSTVSKDMKLGARQRILTYFRKYTLTVISSEELMVVSGITEFARRVRELRVQEGWPIISGNVIKSMFDEGEKNIGNIEIEKLRANEYIMLNTGQDRDAAYRWNVSNSIRKEKASVKEKLIKYFRENVGKEINGEELAYLAKDAKEWARRVRELRTEDGWPIKTCNTGRPDLPIGVYLLEEDKQAESHDRKIDDTIRIQVLERDLFKCRKCGWKQEDNRDGDPRHLLELHHLEYHVNKGSNSVENLVTICNVHHDEIHKNKLNKPQVLSWLLRK